MKVKKILLGISMCTALCLSSAFTACNNGGNNGDDGQSHTHTLVEHAYREPASCTENGNILYWECTACGKYFSDSAGGDEYTDKSEVVITAQHSLSPVEYKAPTCTENGNEPYWACNVCHAYFNDAEAENTIEEGEVFLEALGHDYVYNKAHNTQVSCSIAGWNEYHTCSRCQYTTESGYFANHTLRQYNGTYFCGSCGIDLMGTAGLEYTLNGEDDTYTVTGVGSAVETAAENAVGGTVQIVIPCMYEGKQVTAIGANAFKDCNEITSVVIVSGVTSIGQGAFSGCTSITAIDIPTTVTSIGKEAFYCCESLEYVKIPSGVTEIAERTFARCSELKGVEISAGVKRIGDSAFAYCRNLVHLEFAGTKYQWDLITRADTWDDNTEQNGGFKEYLVYCSEATFTAYGDDVNSFHN